MAADLILLSRVSYRDKAITGPRMRNLFALLAGELRTGCSVTRLTDELWWDDRPENPVKALQILVSRARAQLGSDLIASTTSGYRLALPDELVDTSAVLLSASAAAQRLRDGDNEAALTHAEAGLAYWQGADEAEPTDPLSSLRAERKSTYRTLHRIRALSVARLGRREDALDLLTDVLRDRPRDEEVLLELLRCEAPATALARYEAYRRDLRDDLGTDPGRALQNLHQQLLQGEAPVVRSGVPHDPNPLLGRDDDLAAVTAMLRSSRVTSIVGAGGLGKTRLAHAVSREADQSTVYFVPLAGVSTDDDVAGAVASALGVGDSQPMGRPARSPDVLTSIISALGKASVLLVLDNCEHVIRGAAGLVHTLVALHAEVRVLTTSRAPLDISSEAIYLLPELDLAASVQLFRQRATAARPTVSLPEDVLVELCQRLDGLPLAVELAAARVRVMSLVDIAARLADRFSLLRSSSRDTPDRHRTMEAVIEWSWNLLDPESRRAMRALSIFPDGFTAQAAAELLCTGDALDTVARLADQSLLKVVDTRSGARFRMLETVREFSSALRDDSENHAVTTRFLGWATDFGTRHHDVPFGSRPGQAVALIRSEQDNLQLALTKALELGHGPAVAATAAVLASLWTVDSNFTRMARLTEQTRWFLSHYRPQAEHVEAVRTAATLSAIHTFLLLGPRSQAGAMRSLATLRRLPPAPPDSLIRGAQAALLGTARSDEPYVAWITHGLVSYQHEHANDVEGAVEAAKRAFEAIRDVPSAFVHTAVHARLGEVYLLAERGAEARRHLEATLPLLTELDATVNLVRLRWSVALACLLTGDVDDAERWIDEVTANPEDDPVSLCMRAEIMLARGEVEAGLRAWRRVADRFSGASGVFGVDAMAHGAWSLEAQAVTVVAHAQHGRLAMVEDIAGKLPGVLESALRLRPSTVDYPILGAVLVAIAMADIEHGRSRAAARMIALAANFHFSCRFQPTMSPARAHQTGMRADPQAYADAVSAYAQLGPGGLPAAALAELEDRFTAPDRG